MPKPYFAKAVADAGGGYGVHPIWQPFIGNMKFYSFEPDRQESLQVNLAQQFNMAHPGCYRHPPGLQRPDPSILGDRKDWH